MEQIRKEDLRENGKMRKVLVRLTDLQYRKMEGLRATKYRGATMSQAFRWMVEDMWANQEVSIEAPMKEEIR